MSWATLTVAFALHVVDEATHNFLSWYNPVALTIRERLGESVFPPTFTFAVWLTGLTVAVLVLAALTPFLRERRGWLVGSYIYATIHILNGLAHIAVSVWGRWLAPGVISAPFLLAAALWLLIQTERVRAAMRLSNEEL